MTLIQTILAAAVVIGLTSGLVGVFFRRYRATLVAIAIGGFATVVLTPRLGANQAMGVFRWWYVVAVLAIPLTAAVLLVGHGILRRRDDRVLGRFTLPVMPVLVLALPAAGIYGSFIEPYRLEVDRVELSAPELTGTLRIGVLSDIQTRHVGDHEWAAANAVLAENPDLILISGDFYQGPADRFDLEAAHYRELLTALADVPFGLYIVEGDVDTTNELRAISEGTGAVWLHNQIRAIETPAGLVAIGGSELAWSSHEAVAMADELDALPTGVFTIRLSHRPGAVQTTGPNTDLIVAGHTHGGQISLPFVGPPVTLSDVPRHVAAGGLHELDGIPIYVSTGVGMEREPSPEVRFGVRPSVGIIDLIGTNQVAAIVSDTIAPG